MKTRVQVALNDVWMHDLDDSIVLQSFDESKPSYTVSTASVARRVGSIVTGTERQYIDVTLSFCLRMKNDYAERVDVLNRINAWAMQGGQLITNYRSGQHLDVICTGMAEIGHVREWTHAYTLTFRACYVPFWQDDDGVTWSAKNLAAANTTMTIPGTAPTVIRGSVTNVSTVTINAVSITAAEKTMSFSGLGLLAGETLIIGYDERQVLQLTITGTDGTTRSAMAYRTTDSCDELTVEAGTRAVSVIAGNVCNFALTAEGRYW